MSIAAIGWDAQLGLAEEASYGAVETTSTHWLPIISHSLQCDQKIDPVPFLSSGNAAFNNVRDDALLGHDVAGEIETIPAYESTAFALLLMYAMGAVSTGAGPPYIHTFTPSISAADTPGLSIQSIDGSQADLDMAMVYEGCLVNTMELSWDALGFGRAKFGIIGKRGYGYTAVDGSPAYPTAEEMLGHHVGPLVWDQSHVLTRFGVRLNRGLVRRSKLGTIYTDRPQPGGMAEIMAFGTMEIDEDNQAYYADYLANTQADASVTITGVGANHRLVVNMHNAKIVRLSKPIDRAGVLTFDFEMRCKADASDHGLSLALRNALAAPY
jgi:hypothetical protein